MHKNVFLQKEKRCERKKDAKEKKTQKKKRRKRKKDAKEKRRERKKTRKKKKEDKGSSSSGHHLRNYEAGHTYGGLKRRRKGRHQNRGIA